MNLKSHIEGGQVNGTTCQASSLTERLRKSDLDYLRFVQSSNEVDDDLGSGQHGAVDKLLRRSRRGRPYSGVSVYRLFERRHRYKEISFG